ncbi:MAG: AGE family epimerase/isomerase [Erythrobacter sp.]
MDQVEGLAASAQSWMKDQAFPFWAERGPNPDGGFFERLDLNGIGIVGEDSRVRVQARMAISFTIAAEMGWEPVRARALAQRALGVLVADCRRPDGLYGKMVRPGIGLSDDTGMAYDSAFALLAFAMAYRAFESSHALQAGQELSRAIDQHLMCSTGEGGAREVLPAPIIRTQNPHMHLTEASLAWHQASGDSRALQRAKDIIQFVETRFFREDLGLLVEEFEVSDSENRCEVGHMFEWVWILGQMRHTDGGAPMPLIDALYAGAMRSIEPFDYVPLAQNLDGQVLQPKQRTWAVAEKLKAHITHWRLHDDLASAEEIVRTGQMLFVDHIDAALPGAWNDVIDPQRKLLATDITPATGYHLFQAFQELTAFSDEFLRVEELA